MQQVLGYKKIITILIITVSVCAVLYKYLHDPYLWFDEAGQFWLSKGLNHYSEPLSHDGTVVDVLLNNRNYNHDPGGFSCLLHYWISIGGSHWVYLRILPMLFFLFCSWLIYRISSVETKDKMVSCIIGAIMFVLPIFTNRITELRAYSMEMCGTMLGVFLIYRFRNDFTIKRLLLLSFAMSLFCTSRYSYIIVAFCISIYVLLLLWRQNEIRLFIKKAIAYGFPLTMAVLIIYFGMLRYQGGGTQSIEYAAYLSQDLRLLYSPMSLLFYSICILYGYLYSHKKNTVLHSITLLVSSAFFVLSFLNLYPWDLHRAISVFLLMTICWLITIAKWILSYSKTWTINISIISYVAAYSVLVLFFNHIHVNPTQTQVDEFTRFVTKEQYNTIFIKSGFSPILRYQFEYGLLLNNTIRSNYPHSFVFQKGNTHNGSANNNVILKQELTKCDIAFGRFDEDQYLKSITGYNYFFSLKSK